MNALAGFWSGGFEGADHVNAAGVPLDLVRASGHLDQLEDDHCRAAAAGLSSVRESIGWRLSENRYGVIDLDRVQRVATSAARHGLQVVWTLMHYGLPDGLSLHEDAFIERFARFAEHVARLLGPRSKRAPVFIPINEISFLAWAASQPHLLHAPHNTVGMDDETVRNRGYEVKCRLVRAALLAMRAMKAVEPRSIFMHAEPLVHVVAPRKRPELAELAQVVCGWQWQAWDLLAGVERPELGGHPGSIDVVGLNHYHDSQWELDTGHRLDWHAADARRQRLSDLMVAAWQRIGKPLMLAETSHVGSGRARWLHEMAAEVAEVRRRAVPVVGMCLYPLIDRPDWNETGRWHRSGLWHVAHTVPGLPRRAETHSLAALKSWQQHLPNRVNRHDGNRSVVVVMCHRPWGVATHRTRQLMQQISLHWHVVWLDEPHPWDGSDRLESRACGPTLELLIPHLAGASSNPAAWCSEALHTLVREHLRRKGLKPDAVWLTQPAALQLARAIEPGCLVYEIGAAVEAQTRQHAQALRLADVVVAADKAHAQACQSTGTAVHLLASGVNLQRFHEDAFDPLGWPAMEACALQGHLPGPRVGYAGAIDERMDLALITRIAQARPGWHFVMVGPLRQLDAGALPRAANITWLGEQTPDLIPALMSQWSLAWLPWHTGPATAACFPSHVLEYLASGLAVVTPWLCELEPLAAAGVRLSRDADTLLDACEKALAQPVERRADERRIARQLLQTLNWEVAARQAMSHMSTQATPHNTPRQKSGSLA